MARKQFGSQQQSFQNPDELEFDIVGITESTGQPFAETFRRKRKLQSRKITNLMERAAGNGGMGDATVVFPFIEGCLADDENRRRFQALTAEDNEEQIIEIDTLSELVNWLVEQFGGQRPLGQSGNSLPGGGGMPNTAMGTGYSQG